MSANSKRDVAMYGDDERRGGLIPAVTALVLKPIRPFVSPSARRTYLATFLVVSTAFILLGIAVVAYVLFYYSYIPRVGFERTIHLQFDNVYAQSDPRHAASITKDPHPYPYGSVNLAPDFIGAQPYDVHIELSMPRTPENTDAGNFMLEANMYAAGPSSGGGFGTIVEAFRPDNALISSRGTSSTLLATSRRSAILPYRSRIVDMLHKATELHWYLLGFRSEAAKLIVPVYESVAFAKGRASIPATLRLEVQSTHRLQIYSAKAHFRARFRGLRWVMYNHRIISAIFFTGTFWTTELVFAGLAWAALAMRYQRKSGTHIKSEDRSQDDSTTVKQEDVDEDHTPSALSETERTFPTLSSQHPLRYASPTESGSAVIIKREDEDEPLPMPEAIARAAEADDEEEDEDMDFFDSGIGTSLESSGPSRNDSMRRRRGRMSGGGSNGKDGF